MTTGTHRPPATDDALAAEGLLALREEGPSAAAKQQLLAGLGVDPGPPAPSAARRRGALSPVIQGLGLGFVLGVALVVLRVWFR